MTGSAGPLANGSCSSHHGAAARRRWRWRVPLRRISGRNAWRSAATRVRRVISRSTRVFLPVKGNVPVVALVVSLLMFFGVAVAASLLAPDALVPPLDRRVRGGGAGEGGTAVDASVFRNAVWFAAENAMKPNPPATFRLAPPIRGGHELHSIRRKTKAHVRHRLVDEHVYCGHEEALEVAKERLGNARIEVLMNGYADGGSDVVRVLVGNYSVPLPLANAFPERVAAQVLFKMHYMAARRPAVGVRLLIVHVQNGLGNRLRAMAGGIALAKYTGRLPVVVWEKDAHLSAKFSDLFEHSAGESAIGDIFSGSDPEDGASSARQEPTHQDDASHAGSSRVHARTRRRSAGVSSTDSYIESGPGSSATMDLQMEALLYRDFILLDSFLPWAAVSAPTDRYIPVNQMRKETMDESSPPLLFADEDEAGESGETKSMLAHGDQGAEADSDNSGGDGEGGGESEDGEKGDSSGGSAEQPSGQAAAITPDHHLYLKTAYVPITSPLRGVIFKSDIDPLLRRLVPVETVQRIVSERMPANIHAAVGVHIRSRSLANDNVDVDKDCEYTSDGAGVTDFWRSQSQVPVFAEKMQRYLARNPTIHFFVATDDFRTVEVLKAVFPGRIAHIPRTCDDRTPACVQYALADLMCLGRTRKIIGSNWSSFSEAAGRLSGGPLYLSGVHFGRSKIAPTRSFLQRMTHWTADAITSRGLSVTDPFYKCKRPEFRARLRRLHR